MYSVCDSSSSFIFNEGKWDEIAFLIMDEISLH